jgi:hypothetical protein
MRSPRSVEPHYNIRHTVQISAHAISGRFQPWKGSSEAINRLFHYLPEAWGKRSAARFREVRGAFLRSVSLAMGGTSKKRPSPPLHKVPTRSNKVSPRTFQTALVLDSRLARTAWSYKPRGKVKLSLCLTKHHATKAYRRSGGIAPRILWSRHSFTLRALYPQGKSPWYPLDRRLGGPQSRSGGGCEEKNSQPPPGIEP